jgi:hypothetical protein
MRIFLLISFFILLRNGAYPQASTVYQRGLSAEENLKAITALGPYNPGGIGFDNRYEGVKGSPRMLDTLLPSFLRLNGQDYYIDLKSDIDLVNNAMIYMNPASKKLLTVPIDFISELVIKKNGKELLFLTTYGKAFEKEIKPQRFYQVLYSGQYQFIKVPVKIFVQADYKGAYSTDRRYDEYQSKDRYYLIGSDGIFHQIQLNKKSVSKLYPDKKDLVDKSENEESFPGKEEMIISILSKF